MAVISNQQFQLINSHEEYIEFVVSYTLGQDYCIASGIGWMNEVSSKYYLWRLRSNGNLAEESFYKKAQLVSKNSSYKFKNEKLDILTVTSIESIFRQMPTRQQVGPIDAPPVKKLRLRQSRKHQR